MCSSKDMTGENMCAVIILLCAEPGCHMAPTADSVTLFLVIKLVINDLRIFISSLLPLWQFHG